MEALQNRRSYGKMECLPLWEGEDFGQAYGIQARCYWEHPWGTHGELREHIDNPLRT